MRLLWLASPILALCLAPLAACGSDTGEGGSGGTTTSATSNGGGGSNTGGGGSNTGGGGAAPTPLCETPTPVACADQVILDMNFQPDPAPGAITTTADGAGFKEEIDATAGGPFATTPDSYVYGKFTKDGLTKVAISDEQSLDSMDWDIAFRRYVVRINSGDSGPSCVQGARVPGAAKFEDVSAVPANLAYHTDDYFTDSCMIIPDGSGLPGSPATALSSFWTYPGCVQMTDHVFVIALADGRHVKLVVDSYYSPTVQETCDTTGSVPMSNTGSANYVVRWAYLP